MIGHATIAATAPSSAIRRIQFTQPQRTDCVHRGPGASTAPSVHAPYRRVCGDRVLLLAKGFAVPAGSASGPPAQWAPNELPTLVP